MQIICDVFFYVGCVVVVAELLVATVVLSGVFSSLLTMLRG
jgi:hypothetical protein